MSANRNMNDVEKTPGLVEDVGTVAIPTDPRAVKSEDAKEINGPKGPEPTRFGDWERKGRCVDF